MQVEHFLNHSSLSPYLLLTRICFLSNVLWKAIVFVYKNLTNPTQVFDPGIAPTCFGWGLRAIWVSKFMNKKHLFSNLGPFQNILVLVRSTLKTRCGEPKGVIGWCRARLPRWTYDKHSRKCEKFYYGGCRGDANNFMNKRACENVCGSGNYKHCPNAYPHNPTMSSLFWYTWYQ